MTSTLIQLADDTSLLAETSETLTELFRQVLRYSDKRFMVANTQKTYLHLSPHPYNQPLLINGGTTISVTKDTYILVLTLIINRY